MGGLLSLARRQLAFRYQRVERNHERAVRWGHYFSALHGGYGVAWIYVFVVFFTPESAPVQIFLCVTILGLVSGAAIIAANWITGIYYCYTMPVMFCMAGRMVYEGGRGYWILAVLVLVYLLMIKKIATNSQRYAYEVINTGFDNVDLAESLRREKERVELANVAKSRFLAAASHDLRQPLHALGLFVSVLESPDPHIDRALVIRNVSRCVNSLEELLGALLDVSRLDAGVIKPVIRSEPLSPLLDRLTAEFEPQAIGKGLQWEVSIEDVVVATDMVLLGTVLRNLISNAIRYTHRGVVSVTVRSEAEGVLLSVRDTGIGIAAEFHEAIFQEFFQLHNAERDRREGLGLGLSIVARLSRLLDYRLTMRSAPGEGTIFRLCVPQAAHGLVPASSDQEVLSIQADASMMVLVIDDDEDICIAMAALVATWGHRVVAVASMDAALGDSMPMPDAIIADYRLRDNLTGASAIRAVRQRWQCDIPAVVVTGDTAPERILEIEGSGFLCLHKPVAPAKLRAFLRSVQHRSYGEIGSSTQTADSC